MCIRDRVSIMVKFSQICGRNFATRRPRGRWASSPTKTVTGVSLSTISSKMCIRDSLYGPEKPFGTIRYYRKPYTMQRTIEEAFKLYSGDKPLGLFADKLEHNLQKK